MIYRCPSEWGSIYLAGVDMPGPPARLLDRRITCLTLIGFKREAGKAEAGFCRVAWPESFFLFHALREARRVKNGQPIFLANGSMKRDVLPPLKRFDFGPRFRAIS